LPAVNIQVGKQSIALPINSDFVCHSAHIPTTSLKGLYEVIGAFPDVVALRSMKLDCAEGAYDPKNKQKT
jgi:hypothetical protein